MTTPTGLNKKIKEALTYAAILALGLGIGVATKTAWEWYNAPAQFIQTDTSKHFANVDKKVIMYSTQWCQFCKKAKVFFAKNNIDYVERDIESGDPQIMQLFDSLENHGTPQVVIGDKIINGFNVSLISSALKEQKLL